MEDHEQGREALLPMKNINALFASLDGSRHGSSNYEGLSWRQLAIGPAIKDGFYYDVDIDTTLSEDSLAQSKNK